MNSLEPKSDREKVVLRYCLIAIVLLVVLDHGTKLLVLHHISIGDTIPIIPGCFDLVSVRNTGAAWGMLSDYSWLLLVVSVVVLILVVVFFRSLAEGWPERYLALALVVSGVIGNCVDRVWRGAVVDFLDFYVGKHHWPAFNVADSAITVGVVLYSISCLFRPQKPSDSDDVESTS